MTQMTDLLFLEGVNGRARQISVVGEGREGGRERKGGVVGSVMTR